MQAENNMCNVSSVYSTTIWWFKINKDELSNIQSFFETNYRDIIVKKQVCTCLECNKDGATYYNVKFNNEIVADQYFKMIEEYNNEYIR